MSGIDNIIQKIQEDNQAKIKKLQEETAIQIEEIKAHEDNIAQGKIDAIELKTTKQIEEINRNAKSAADMECRKQQLSARQEILVKTFDQALAQMKAMSADKKTAFIKKQVLENASGDEQIVAGNNEGIYTDALLSELNRSLTAAGKKGNLTYELVDEDMDGFILKKGGMQINLTYQEVIKQIQNDIDTQVSKLLFEI